MYCNSTGRATELRKRGPISDNYHVGVPTVDLHKMALGLQKTTEATPEEQASAQRNLDALSLMSKDDRDRFAGSYAVVMRNGGSAGKVIGFGPTQQAAIMMAQTKPEYGRINCAVQYIT